jgi:hypothetical protein
MTEVVEAIKIAAPIQSNRFNFSPKEPTGKFSLKKIATRTEPTPMRGRFR